jgi:hypothetical protein
MLRERVCALYVTAAWACSLVPITWAQPVDELERGFQNPPPEARPHVYWLWLNGYMDPDSAQAELQAMKEAGLSGVLVFDMGAQGEKAFQPPPGPAFLSPDWMSQFRQALGWAKERGLQCDLSVVSSWDLGGEWTEPRHASMALHQTEMTLAGGQAIDVELPFPPVPPAVPKDSEGKPVFWRDVAVLAVRDAQRQPGRQTFVFSQPGSLLEVTGQVDRQSRLRWDAPPGDWTILRYVCMNTGERLKVPSPASDGWATDHFSAEATRAHMDYVIARLRDALGNPAASGLVNLYLASYEVRGLVWSPGFTDEFQRRRGYDMKPFLPAIFGSTVGGDDTTARFLFDYRKTLGEVLVDAYYRTAREAAHAAGLSIKSEAGGPGPPVHNVPVDALLANSLVLPDGTDYALLVLPKDDEAHPAVLEKIEQLVAAGATVVGPRPSRAVGLEGYPASDASVGALADRLWGDLDGQVKTTRAHGKGRIIWGRPLRDILLEMEIRPDFDGREGLDHIHRREGGTDLYFVRNARPEAVESTATFRAGNREPELWDPVTGTIQPSALYRMTERGVELPLALPPHGSMFVVFRRPARSGAFTGVSPGARVEMRDGAPWLLSEGAGVFQVKRDKGQSIDVRVGELPDPLTLERDWSVELQSPFEPPRQLHWPKLVSWSEHSDPAVRFFSGRGRYRKSFVLPAGWKTNGRQIDLDLGNLWVIGQAWLNGKPLGVLWTPPFRADCTDALREGMNELVIEVSNTWFNRLAGDARLPAAQRRTRTNVPQSGGAAWARLDPLPSGLFGPVRLIAIARRPVPTQALPPAP